MAPSDLGRQRVSGPADYDLKLLVKTWKDEYGADDYACSMVLRTIADSVYLPEGQPLV